MLTLILSLLMLVLRAMEFVILIWVLMSWLPGAQQSALGQLLGRIAGIVVDPIRRVMPRTGIIDFTPLIGCYCCKLPKSAYAQLHKHSREINLWQIMYHNISARAKLHLLM